MLTPDQIQTLTTIAFCLEPLAEKSGCTTRTVDIVGKPLTDFLIAGISVGPAIRRFAASVITDERAPIFAEYCAALQMSTQYKSPKIISMGLLEIIFPVVYARLRCEERDRVVDVVVSVMQQESPQDVVHLSDARKIAWQTSGDVSKRAFDSAPFVSARSPWEFYERMHVQQGGPESSRQWAQEYFDGLPILRQVLDVLTGITDATAMVAATAQVHADVVAARPGVKVGMVADMCAAGLFLHLTFLQ
ncbi:MAG: hypothetical protein AAB384_03960 [Patescibacteria group bacterium]